MNSGLKNQGGAAVTKGQGTGNVKPLGGGNVAEVHIAAHRGHHIACHDADEHRRGADHALAEGGAGHDHHDDQAADEPVMELSHGGIPLAAGQVVGGDGKAGDTDGDDYSTRHDGREEFTECKAARTYKDRGQGRYQLGAEQNGQSQRLIGRHGQADGQEGIGEAHHNGKAGADADPAQANGESWSSVATPAPRTEHWMSRVE